MRSTISAGRRRGLELLPAVLLVVAVLTAGCRTPRRAPPRVVSPAELAQLKTVTTTRIVPAANVYHVNRPLHYVILECAVLPSAGEQARVYRGDSVVAELGITDYRRGSFVVADIQAGHPRTGDAVRLERTMIVPVTEEVQP